MATNKHDRIEKLLDVLGSGLYEKETAVKLGLLTALAGESMFMLGAPGCAKSMITRRIKEAFKADNKDGVKYFETLLNQFTTPEEVFGNISLKALNGELPDENGNKKEEYRRLTEGMLPEADIAFLDEIWKASPAILNTLLTIVNERKFHNGSKVMNVPLKALFAASNELPAKGKGLEALYDRFIFRLPVDFIKNEDDFFEMIDQPAHEEFKLNDEEKKLLISNTELKEWSKEIDKVTLSEVSKQVISAIRKEMTLLNDAMSDEDKKNGELFEVGDRRWKKIAHILKTSAFLNDRNEVDLMDCSLIENCIWGTEKQQKKAKEIVEKCLKENGIPCDSAIEDIQEQIEEFTANIDEQWFESAPKLYDMSDGHKACKIINPTETTFADHTVKPFYISKDFKWPNYSDRYGMLYDANGNRLGPNYNFAFIDFKLENNTVTWTDCWRKQYYNDSSSVHKVTIEISDKEKVFSDIAHSTLQKNFTKDNYTPISNFIKNEIDKLKEQKAKDAVPFEANLFADQSYNTSITSKIDNSIKDLEDKQVELDKQKDRYYSDDLEPELSVGDVILNDGSIFTAKEIKNLSDEQKENVIAVVCISDESKYAIGVNQYSKKWTEMKQCCVDYSTKVADDYSKGWIVPKIELLRKIWENRDVINKSLKAVNGETLDGKEYWSYSETEDKSAAMYMTFDDRGHQDHTTKDHEYTICVIRDWRKF